MNIVLVEVSPYKNVMTMAYHPHPGLAYMAACLENNAHAVRIVDPVSSNNDMAQMVKLILQFNPRVVGFTSTTASRFRAIEAINSVKRETDALIVAGGPHFHPTARDAMSKVPAIDCIVKGEGEITMLEIVKALEANEPLSGIAGIFLRQDNEIIETPDRQVNEDLDSLPLPAYHLFDLKRYHIRLPGTKTVPALSVISSRGCPCKCIFCSITALKKHNFRRRSPELFLDEVAYFKKAQGYDAFLFNDDTITMDRKHIVDICNGIIKRRLNIRWSALARVNTVDKDLLSLMKAAGCCYIMYGIESGSDTILAKVKKGITVSQAVNAIEITAKVGIPFDALFMVSFPGETMQDLRKTIGLINRFSSYPKSRAPYGFTCIYPGTEIEQLAYREGILPGDFSWNTRYVKPVYSVLGTDPFSPCWESSNLPLEDIKALIFKTRPLSYKINRVFSKLRGLSPRDILSSIRIGMRVFTIR